MSTEILFEGDEVRTGRNGKVSIQLPDSSVMRVGELTTLIMGNLRQGGEIQSPNAKTRIRG